MSVRERESERENKRARECEREAWVCGMQQRSTTWQKRSNTWQKRPTTRMNAKRDLLHGTLNPVSGFFCPVVGRCCLTVVAGQAREWRTIVGLFLRVVSLLWPCSRALLTLVGLFC